MRRDEFLFGYGPKSEYTTQVHVLVVIDQRFRKKYRFWRAFSAEIDNFGRTLSSVFLSCAYYGHGGWAKGSWCLGVVFARVHFR
mmetsp:Transcript_20982/g.34203  ORF Transcript_20982/g.34203 Transcript_20982/m.34203 type:complete len:84 (+) Transcript_20982:755-1006(+)